MILDAPGKIDRRRISQLNKQSQDHYPFLNAAGNLHKICGRIWADRGLGYVSRHCCELLKSGIRRTEENEEMRIIFHNEGFCGRSVKLEIAGKGNFLRETVFFYSSIPIIFGI